MIAKPKTSTNSGTFGKAGDAAERQMAFYLDRSFGQSRTVQLFHDLRIVHNGNVAQIDHLVIHRFGMIIVESKSVTTKVKINSHGEWIRCWGGKEKGMPSPIQQAKLQRDLLIDLLENHATQLLGKFGGILQCRFGGCPFLILVAISDDGIIERQGSDPPELFKADRICDRIVEEIQRHKRSQLRLGFGDPEYGMYRLNQAETTRIVTFLLEQHTPARPESDVTNVEASVDVVQSMARMDEAANPPTGREQAPPSIPKSKPSPPPKIACKHCGSTNIHATHGRYGYYMKCSDCSKNTPIDYTCTACGKKGRVRKQGNDFDRVCSSCGHEERIWRNDAPA